MPSGRWPSPPENLDQAGCNLPETQSCCQSLRSVPNGKLCLRACSSSRSGGPVSRSTRPGRLPTCQTTELLPRSPAHGAGSNSVVRHVAAIRGAGPPGSDLTSAPSPLSALRLRDPFPPCSLEFVKTLKLKIQNSCKLMGLTIHPPLPNRRSVGSAAGAVTPV